MAPGNHIKLIECPRDAMQGWAHPISTEKKAAYINALLKVGFHTIDFGSFVSPKAIPQMADTVEVLKKLDLKNTTSKLLAIIANKRGAEEAVIWDEITYLGFPFSVSETFQIRNTHSSIQQSLERVEEIQNLCVKAQKKLVVYLSMAFGNPYGDVYNEEIVFSWAYKLAALDIGIISLADTVGLATATQVGEMTKYLVKMLPGAEIGVHLHSAPNNRKEKLEAALQAGCRRIDGAMKGIGGCPMADDELVGNMDTEFMVDYFAAQKIGLSLNAEALSYCSRLASEIFI
ncbi:MAG TPA: hydroxymethylglutaryl-CoA lyase [Ferruginibacter sp.]|nr:hydroxymethylglutaryl-CoA lyase [Bacteroidota bacterium]HMT96911.1 hydroxymethylglutaryl-CoA lyase [Ferruginibacter sp.]